MRSKEPYRRFARQTMVDMHAVDLGLYALDLCNRMNGWRDRCKNLSGSYRGKFKRTTHDMEETVRAFMEKVQTVGDVAHLKQTVFELTEELKESRRETAMARKEAQDARIMVRELRKEVEGLKARGGIDRGRVNAVPHTEENTRKSARRSSSSTEGWRTVTGRTARRKSDRTSDGGAGWTSRDDVASQSGVGEYGRGPIGAPGAGTRGRVSGPPRRGGAVRVVENVQIVPPRDRQMRAPRDRPLVDSRVFFPSPRQQPRWRDTGTAVAPMDPPPDRGSDVRAARPARGREFAGGNRGGVRARRRPAVVTITAGEGGSYAEVLRRAREKVSLQELGIHNTKIRRAFNGELIIEIPEENGADLASVLRDKLAGTLGSDVRVDRPVAKGEVKISGIDPSTSLEEISKELTKVSGCPSADINVSYSSIEGRYGYSLGHLPP